MGISSYSTTPASNTSISGINIAEGCAPSGINDALRQMMADIASGVQLAQLPTATGTANALVVALTPAKGAYTAGERFQFISSASGNTGAATINYGTGGVISIKKKGPNPANLVDLALGDIPASSLIDVEYDGTRALLLNPAKNAHGADIASAGTVNLDTATGDYVYITGTTGITAITLAEGVEVTTKFTGILTITNGASLVAPGATNYTTAVGDVIMWRGEASGVVRAVGGVRANGQAFVSPTLTGSLTGITDINGAQLAGFRNHIINGGMGIWQRGTTQALSTSVVYGALDRWASYMSTSAAGIANRDTSVPTPSTSVPGFQYSLKLGRTAGSSLTNQIATLQALETVNSIPLQGKVVTLSVYLKAGANFSASGSQPSIVLRSGTGVDQSAATGTGGGWTGDSVIINNAPTITTSWVRYTVSATVPTTATQLLIQISYVPTGTAGADDNIYITGVQLEPGATATPFEHRSWGTELHLCQRYYQKSFDYATAPAQAAGAGLGEFSSIYCRAAGSLADRIAGRFTQEMRAAPTMVGFNPSSANAQVRDLSVPGDCSAASIVSISSKGFRVDYTGNAASANGNVVSYHVTADAEL